MKLVSSHAGCSDRGRVRAQNEDRWVAHDSIGLYAVSDGIAGVPAGGLASEIVVKLLPTLMRQQIHRITSLAHHEHHQALTAVLMDLSDRVHHAGVERPELNGMGATVVLTLVHGSEALIAHMGDSRAYLWRNWTLRRLTRDHTIAELLLDRGELSFSQIETHPSRGQLTRYVGMPGGALPEVNRTDLQDHDLILLCSDGLTGIVKDDNILLILNEFTSLRGTSDRLVAQAVSAGGEDNITVLLISVSEGEHTQT